MVTKTPELFPDVPEDFWADRPTATPDAVAPRNDLIEVDAGVALPVVVVEPDTVDSAAGTRPGEHEPTTAAEPDDVEDADPLAHAPDWVRAHIPRRPLRIGDPKTRRGLKARPRPAAPATPVPPTGSVADSVDLEVRTAVAPLPETELAATTGRARRVGPNRCAVGAAAAAAAVVAVIVGISISVLDADSVDRPVAVPALDSTTTTTTGVAVPGATTAAAPVWCESSTLAGTIVGRGAGDLVTGPGLIQAFEYAYFVEHDAAKVASMMLAPNPIPTIQNGIDQTRSTRTEHCVTVAPTPDPAVFDVALQLRTATGSSNVLTQRITVIDSGAGLKIAALEEVS